MPERIRKGRGRSAESRLRRLKKVLAETTISKLPKLRRRGRRYLPHIPSDRKQQFKEFFS